MDLDREHRYTWSEVRAFDDEQRWELIDGYPYAMSSPFTIHQVISMNLIAALLPSLSGTPCRLLSAPMDVKLSEYDMVQPDLLVVCDSTQLKRTHVEGPPRLVIEILSESTGRHDRVRKLNLYARSGVAEYWLVTPHPPLIEVLRNVDGCFSYVGAFTEAHMLRSGVFPQLALDLSKVFADLPPQPLIEEVKEATPEYLASLISTPR